MASSDSDEIDDSDGDPDFVPVALAQKNQPTARIVLAHVSETDSANNIETILNTQQNSHNDGNQKKRVRKRIRNESQWEKNRMSTAYNSGKAKKFKGEVRERAIKAGCTEKCRRQCMMHFNTTDRTQICKDFWDMNSSARRRDYIVSHVIKADKRRSTTQGPSKRKYSLSYFLNEGAERVQVCQRFFIDTLDITERMVDYNMKQQKNGILPTPPKKTAKNKTADETVEHIKSHIRSFKKVESHYCRADTKREYLDPSLNLRQLFRLYKEKCEAEGRRCVKEPVYRNIFNKNFNLGFHVPSKDACDLCSKYTLQENPSPDEVQEYEDHMRRKDQARTSKEQDKQNISTQVDITVAEFDLQQVMVCPKLNVASAYYLRKLNVYNFTILDLKDKQGYCYVWNEFQCNRGTNDIVSAVWKWLREKELQGIKKVIFFSDTCGGQNRNRIFLTAMIVFLANSNMTSIEQKFFERGHSKMEADSMHSAISREFERRNIFMPSGYMQCMVSANKKQPYIINELSHDSIMDFDSLNKRYMKQDAFNGILKVHHIQCQKVENDVIVRFANEIGGQWEVRPFRKRGVHAGCFRELEIPKAYSRPCGIDKDKKADLKKMMQFIPNDCHAFYRILTD